MTDIEQMINDLCKNKEFKDLFNGIYSNEFLTAEEARHYLLQVLVQNSYSDDEIEEIMNRSKLHWQEKSNSDREKAIEVARDFIRTLDVDVNNKNIKPKRSKKVYNGPKVVYKTKFDLDGYHYAEFYDESD